MYVFIALIRCARWQVCAASYGRCCQQQCGVFAQTQKSVIGVAVAYFIITLMVQVRLCLTSCRFSVILQPIHLAATNTFVCMRMVDGRQLPWGCMDQNKPEQYASLRCQLQVVSRPEPLRM